MFRYSIILIMSLFLVSTAESAESKLKKCPKTHSSKFHNCFGSVTYSNGGIYRGEFQNGKLHGQGTYTWPNGNKYVGDWRDDKRSGQGTLIWVNGHKYVGDWRDNKRSGQGTLIWADGDKYVGDWRDDKKHGHGTYTWVKGNKYVGSFRDGTRNGQGTFTYADGAKYIGGFQNDKSDGVGTFYAADGTIKEYGIYKNDLLHRPLEIAKKQEAQVSKTVKTQPIINPTGKKRVALVIGNGAYSKATPLTNPSNDARAISAMLKKMGFTVVSGTDLNRNAMESTIREFIKEARQADVSLLFYAGHGIQVAGQNYLVPVDASVKDSSAIDFELINVSSIRSHMGGLNTVGIVLLDACRDNPFTRSLARSLGTRSAQVKNGLAPIASTGGGLLVGFATSPGDVAADGKGQNSPFTTGLLKHLPTPGLEIELALKRVKATVVSMTKNQQRPWHNSDLAKEVYLTLN